MTRSDARAVAVLAAIAVALFAIRLTGLPNLFDNEYRIGACVLDALRNGHWIAPRDSLGRLDKPPMLTWLTALATLTLGGRLDALRLYLPTALATLALAVILCAVGRRHFGRPAGFLAGWTYLLSEIGARNMASTRWDGLFALTVTVAAFAAFQAWQTGGGWHWFWLAGAVATLTKGPLGVLLAGMGLLAVIWERRSGTPAPLRGRQEPGIVLYLVLSLGWFALAYRDMGPVVVDQLIRNELVSHAIEHPPGRRLLDPTFNFLGNFAPWSFLALVGMVRVVRTPALDPTVRRFERFCFSWFVGGLLVFSVSPHNPARLLYPIIPPAALLGGRELAAMVSHLRPRTAVVLAAVTTLIGLGAVAVTYHRLEERRPQVQRTLALMRLADDLRAAGPDLPLAHVDAPFGLQLLLGTLHPPVKFAEAAALLRGPEPAFVVVKDMPRLRAALGADAPRVWGVAGCTVKGRPYLHVIGNRPQLAVVP